MDFAYESVPTGELKSGYWAGGKIKETTRLDRIDINYNTSTLVRRYELSYEAGLSVSGHSRLASMQECAGSPLDCYPATSLTWQSASSGLTAESASSANVPSGVRPLSIDLNGDGRQDLIWPSSATSGGGTWISMLANSSGTFNAPVNSGIVSYTTATPIDYNADGLSDLLAPLSGGTWGVILGTATGLASSVINTGIGLDSAKAVRALDLNGDGLEDLV